MTEPKIPEMRIGLLEGLWTVAMADQHGWVKVGTWEGLPDHTVANWRPIAPLPDDETEYGVRWRLGKYVQNAGADGLREVQLAAVQLPDAVAMQRRVGPWVEVKQS